MKKKTKPKLLVFLFEVSGTREEMSRSMETAAKTIEKLAKPRGVRKATTSRRRAGKGAT